MLPQIKKDKRYVLLFVCFLILLLGGGIFFLGFLTKFLKNGILSVSRQIIFLKNKIFESELGAENARLRQELVQLKMKEVFSEVIFEENKNLKSVLSAGEDNSFIAAAVLSRPGYGLYNSLLLDSGLNYGIKEGMRVTAFGDVLIGYVEEVMPELSRVKLVSYPEQETNAFVNNQIAVLVVGAGGENMEIVLPSDVKVELGDRVTTLGNNYFLLGIIEKITKSPADPFQKIFFRLPINIQELRSVFIVK